MVVIKIDKHLKELVFFNCNCVYWGSYAQSNKFNLHLELKNEMPYLMPNYSPQAMWAKEIFF